MRKLAGVVGKLILAYRSLGKNHTGLMSWGCYHVISGVGYRWESPIKLSDEARLDIQWCSANLTSQLSGDTHQPFSKRPHRQCVQQVGR